VAPVSTLVLTHESEALEAAAKADENTSIVSNAVVSDQPPSITRTQAQVEASSIETESSELMAAADSTQTADVITATLDTDLPAEPPRPVASVQDQLNVASEDNSPIEPADLAVPADFGTRAVASDDADPTLDAVEIPVSNPAEPDTSAEPIVLASNSSDNNLTPEAVTPLSGLAAERREVLNSVLLKSRDIQFIDGSSIFLADSEDLLNRIFEDLFLYAESDIIIEVNRRESSGGISNAELAQERGERVKDFLVGRGLEEERLIVRVLPARDISSAAQYLSIQANFDE